MTTIRIENNDESYDIDILKKIEIEKLKNEKNIQIIINNDLKLSRVETKCAESCKNIPIDDEGYDEDHEIH